MAASISLAGKVAVVTGGGRGIGKAIARRLAEAGAGVVIASRKMENLEATAAEFAGLPGPVVPIACHVGRLDQLEALVRETETRLGPIDVLVNNSATNIGQGPSRSRVTPAHPPDRPPGRNRRRRPLPGVRRGVLRDRTGVRTGRRGDGVSASRYRRGPRPPAEEARP